MMAIQDNETAGTLDAENVQESAAAPAAQTTQSVDKRSIWQSFMHFLREVHVEMKKTDWPNRDALTKYTIVVMVTMIAVAVILGVYNWGAEQITNWLLQTGSTATSTLR